MKKVRYDNRQRKDVTKSINDANAGILEYAKK